MRLDTYSLPTKFHMGRLANTTAIIVDVLRASSTIITALENGAAKLIPCQDPGEAAAMASRLGGGCLLAGERGGIKPEGFDLGNSPLEYAAQAVWGRTIMLTTSNGTAAIAAAQGARSILIGGMLNRTAVAEKAVSLGKDIAIICAGTDEMDSADDICAAGAIAEAVSSCAQEPVQASDMTLIASLVYSAYKSGRADLSATLHYSKLAGLGFGEDIKYCLREDISRVVPVLENGAITCMR